MTRYINTSFNDLVNMKIGRLAKKREELRFQAYEYAKKVSWLTWLKELEGVIRECRIILKAEEGYLRIEADKKKSEMVDFTEEIKKLFAFLNEWNVKMTLKGETKIVKYEHGAYCDFTKSVIVMEKNGDFVAIFKEVSRGEIRKIVEEYEDECEEEYRDE